MAEPLRALGIAGSPRKGANSETLLAAALEGAAELGAETEIVRLNDLDYSPCQVCQGCKKAGRCIVKDDMQGVHEKLRAADIWILSSPIYFDGVSGQMKSFFDRLWCFTHEGNKLPGTRAGGVIVTYEDKERARDDQGRREKQPGAPRCREGIGAASGRGSVLSAPGA